MIAYNQVTNTSKMNLQ